MRTNRNPLNFEYTKNNTNLKTVNSTKYVGITITNNLSWNDHKDNIVGRQTKDYVSLAEHLEDATRLRKRLPAPRLLVLY